MFPASRFPDPDATHWSVVSAVGSDDAVVAQQALEEVCRKYWGWVYAHLYARVRDRDQALDLTQAFFLSLLLRGDLRTVRRERGRFRAFLLACLDNFFCNEARNQQRIKRGGGQTILPLLFDLGTGEDMGLREPLDPETPERILGRRRANRILDRVFRQLRREWVDAGKGAMFECLKVTLTGEPPDGGYRELGRQLNLTEDAVKTEVTRMRGRYRRLLEKKMAKYGATKDAINARIQDLASALRP